jgi:signal transduction histidine kinase
MTALSLRFLDRRRAGRIAAGGAAVAFVAGLRERAMRYRLLEAGLYVLVVADLLASIDWRRPGPVLATALAVAALPIRRRSPVFAQLLGLANVAIGYALVAQLVTTYNLARRTTRWRVLIGVVAVVALAQTLGMFFGPQASSPGDYSAQRLVFAVLIVGAPVSTGLLRSAYQRLADQLAELDVRRARENDLLTRTVIARERGRLAREMHDVVSHQVSLIAVQTGAMRMTATDPRTRDSADAIRQLAVRTLQELRQTVSVLREGAEAGLVPQPRLGDLARLVADSQTGAVLNRRDDPREHWTDVTERTAYRAVQEGLTNASKHASGAPIAIDVDSADSTLQVTVRNGAPPRTGGDAAHLPGGGYGLIGLRERAELLGGTFTFGPTADGGFLLTMRLPKKAGRRVRPG